MVYLGYLLIVIIINGNSFFFDMISSEGGENVLFVASNVDFTLSLNDISLLLENSGFKSTHVSSIYDADCEFRSGIYNQVIIEPADLYRVNEDVTQQYLKGFMSDCMQTAHPIIVVSVFSPETLKYAGLNINKQYSAHFIAPTNPDDVLDLLQSGTLLGANPGCDREICIHDDIFDELDKLANHYSAL